MTRNLLFSLLDWLPRQYAMAAKISVSAMPSRKRPGRHFCTLTAELADQPKRWFLSTISGGGGLTREAAEYKATRFRRWITEWQAKHKTPTGSGRAEKEGNHAD